FGKAERIRSLATFWLTRASIFVQPFSLPAAGIPAHAALANEVCLRLLEVDGNPPPRWTSISIFICQSCRSDAARNKIGQVNQLYNRLIDVISIASLFVFGDVTISLINARTCFNVGGTQMSDPSNSLIPKDSGGETTLLLSHVDNPESLRAVIRLAYE